MGESAPPVLAQTSVSDLKTLTTEATEENIKKRQMRGGGKEADCAGCSGKETWLLETLLAQRKVLEALRGPESHHRIVNLW